MTMHYPTSFDEYAKYYDVVPTTAAGYLARFRPDDARCVEWQAKSPAECARLLRQARAAAAAATARPSKTRRTHSRQRPALARRSPSPAARVAVPAVSLRASGTSPGTLSGYAAMYGKPSVNLGGFVETLAPGAFRSTLARIKAGEHDLFLLTEHTQQNILARVSAGNLRLEEDAAGLRFTVELPDTQLGRDVRELVGRGVLRGMSFSFSPIRDSWPQPGSRTLHDLTAYEISIVSSPAYPSTSVMATRGRPDAVGWQVARLKALAARPTRAAIARPAARSTAGIEWR
jgi:hypothetical protein